jgi:DUF2934 family protein
MSQNNAAYDMHAIRQRAHSRWLERGCPTGSAEQDWLDAEREIAAESQAAAASLRTSTTVTTAAVPRAGSARLDVPRAPRSIVTRSAYAPAARLLVALVPDASASVRIAAGTPSPGPSVKGPAGRRGRR